MDINTTTKDTGKRLDVFLSVYFNGLPRSIVQKFTRKNFIRVNNKKIEFNYKLKTYDVINIANLVYEDFKKFRRDKKSIKKVITQSEVRHFKSYILYKDDNLIAINKPQGLPVQGGSKTKLSIDDFLNYLKFEKKEKPKLIHRLDKDTSGVLLVARNKETANKLTNLFRQTNKIKKTYLALVVGIPPKKVGEMDLPLTKKYEGKIEKVYVDLNKGKKAVTKYEVVEVSQKNNVALLKINIPTGRTHQIRVHMKELGYPIVGDGKYGGKKAFVKGFDNKLHLHALEIAVNNELKIKADLPRHFKNSVEKLKV